MGSNARFVGITNTVNEVSFQYCIGQIGLGSDSTCVASFFRFTPNVQHMRSTDSICVESEPVILSELFWKVMLCKRPISTVNSGTREVIDVSLQSSSDDSLLPWSCEAGATIKIFPLNGTAIEKNLAKREYSNLNSTYGVKEVFSWNEFLHSFVKDNEASLEVEIFTDGAHKNAPSNVEQIYTRIHVMLDKVTDMTDYYSTNVTVRGIKWRVHVQKKDYYLGVYIQADDDDFDLSLSYKIDATIKLLTFNDKVKPIVNNFTHVYRRGWTENGFKEFMYWDTFVGTTNDYVVKDKANLLIQFRAEKPKSIWDDDETNTDKQALECQMCHNEFRNGHIMSGTCGHLLCKNCVRTLGAQYTCPKCREYKQTNTIHDIHY